MALTAGVASVSGFQSNTAQLSATATTGGTGASSYQWYRSTVSGFTPGVGNIISGATSLNLSDSGLIPNATYYYKLTATDTTPTTVTYTQVSLTTTAQQLSQNQFAQSPILGFVDQLYNYNTHSCLIDVSQVGTLYAGQAVKVVDTAGGVPKVVACTANTDEVFGFINFDVKTVGFVAGNPCEVSMEGNVIYLCATAAISRGAQVGLDVSSPACVAPVTGSSAANIVGWAYDKAAGAGSYLRVFLKTPSFTFDA